MHKIKYGSNDQIKLDQIKIFTNVLKRDNLKTFTFSSTLSIKFILIGSKFKAKFTVKYQIQYLTVPLAVIMMKTCDAWYNLLNMITQ